MRYPLDYIEVTGEFKEVAVPGTGLPDASGVKRHIGVDFHADIGTPVYAPADGVVTKSYMLGTEGLQVIEARIDGKLWRFLHLSKHSVWVGQTITEGQVIGLSGNSGGVPAHLHIDVRKDGTLYSDSLNNYYDPIEIIKEGDDMGATATQIYYLRRGIYSEDLPVAANDPDVGADYAERAEAYLDYANRNGIDYVTYKTNAEKQIADLKKKVAALEAAGKLPVGKYIKVDNVIEIK